MAHLEIPKTYKLFIGGQFPRTESGRSFSIQNAEGGVLANLCRASRKDFRNAVAAARKAQAGWADRTAYNRSQILYRLAEILDGRSSQFIEGWCLGILKPLRRTKYRLQSIDWFTTQGGVISMYRLLGP